MSEAETKPFNVKLNDDSANRVDFEQMERGADGDADEELGLLADDDEGESELEVKENDGSMRARYAKAGQPDWYSYKEHESRGMEGLNLTEEANDWYLRNTEPNPFFAASIRAPLAKVKDYEEVSGFSKQTYEYTDFVRNFRPHHAKTEGSKGIAMYPSTVVYTTAGMCFPLNSDQNYVYVKDVGPMSLGEIARQNRLGLQISGPNGYTTIKAIHHNGRQKVHFFTLDHTPGKSAAILATPSHIFVCAVNSQSAVYSEVLELSRSAPTPLRGYLMQLQLSLAEIVKFGLKIPYRPDPRNLEDVELVSITDMGSNGSETDVFDIEVDSEDHLFFVNGAIAHNSEIVNVALTSGCSANCAFCFPYDSDVNYTLSNLGHPILIQDLVQGSLIQSPFSETQVTEIIPNGAKECMRYELSDGTVMDLTPDHPVLAETPEGNFIITSIQEVFEQNLSLIKTV